MPASATETARIKVTANSLLRQLEQSSTATEPNHLATLKRQATAKHVKQLLASLEGSVPPTSLLELQHRLARVEATATPPPSQPPTPPKPIYIPTLAPPPTRSSNPNDANYDPYAPPVAPPGPLDFLLPEKPSLPLSLSRPGSRAGSPSPSHSNLLRREGGDSAHQFGGSQRSYSPLPLPPQGGMYQPQRAPSPALSVHSQHQQQERRGSDASLSPTRARATHQPRERRKSTAGGPDDDYEPDAYSPVRERRKGSVDFDLRDEEGGGAGDDSMIDHGSSYGGGMSMDDGEVDPEAGMGGKPDFPGEEEEEDPEAGIGMAVGDGEDELDPEAGGMNYLSSSSTRRPHSTSVSSARLTSSIPPPPSSASSKSALSAPPPPRRGSLSPTVSITPPPSGIRSRRTNGSSRPSTLSRTRSSDQQDRDDLLSGGPPVTSSDLLSHQHDMQNSLLSDLTSLSSRLKTNSQTFSSNLEKDRAVLEGAKEKLEVNHERMIKEGGRLKEGKKRNRGTMCWTVGVVGAVAVAWVVMFLLIKVT